MEGKKSTQDPEETPDGSHAQVRAALNGPKIRVYYEQEAIRKGKRAYMLALTDVLQGG